MKAALELSSKPNRNGLFEIYVRIQEGNKKKRIKANIAVKQNQFKSKNHNMKWVINHPNHVAINADLRALIESYEDVVFTNSVLNDRVKLQEMVQNLGGEVDSHKVLTSVPRFTPELIINSVKKATISKAIIPFWEVKMSQMLNYNQSKGYQQVLNNWKAYTELEKLGSLDFKQIDVNILKGFENYLIGTKKLTSCTAYTNLKKIRKLFNDAIAEKIISRSDYVFDGYKMPKCLTKKKERLNIEELKEFKKVQYESGSLHKTVQQAFLLAFNMAGVRIEDVLTLRWAYVKNDRIEYTMKKTGGYKSFKITPQLKEILDYFKSIATGSIYIIPILEDGIEDDNSHFYKKGMDAKERSEIYKKYIGKKTSLVNKYLKLIADDACIDTRISTHIARHTFATIAIKKTDGNVKFLQDAFDHTDPKITQGYMRDLDMDSMDEGMGKATDI